MATSIESNFTVRPERSRFVQTRFSEPEIELIDREVALAGAPSRAALIRIAVGRFIVAASKERATA